MRTLIGEINGGYARRFNRAHRRVGHLWQCRYKAILVEDGPYFLECSRYIHLNPNRSRLTRPAERYRWSSYRSYVGGPRGVDWVSRERTLAAFDGEPSRYRSWVESGKGERPVDPFERAVAGLVLGGEKYVEKIRAMFRSEEPTADRPSLRKLKVQEMRSAAEVEAVVAEIARNELPRRRRRLLLYALRLHSALPVGAIAKRCGRSPAAVKLWPSET